MIITPSAPMAPVDAYPESYTEAKRALRSPKESRTVWLSSRAAPRNHRPAFPVYDVVGPTTPGDVLTVHVGSGMIPLRVLRGNVSITLGSSWGNVVTVLEAAKQTTDVHVWAGCKVTAYGVDSARFTGDLGRLRDHPLSADHRLDPPAPAPAGCPF